MLNNVDFIELGIVDLEGRLKTRTLMNKNIEKILEEGIGFDGSSVNLSDIEDSDLLAIPDPTTLKIYSSNGHKIAFFLCDVYKDGKPLSYYPRQILKNILKKKNYKFKAGPEIEFYVKKQNFLRNHEYMNPYPLDEIKPLKRILMKKLDEIGFDIKLEHHEVGDGQHEITMNYQDALEMADNIIFYKYYLRIFFKENEKEITFMPKPFYWLNGSGMHIHFTLHNNNGENLFSNNGKLTETALKFIGGILRYSREITLATNQTVNSFKRLVPGFEAPIYISWGYGNRSALIRIPKYRKDNINRIEVRMPDPLCNPYIAIAAIYIAGLKGLEENIIPPDPIQENIYHMKNELETLPSNLEEAIKEAERGTILKKLLNNGFTRLLKEKVNEWNNYMKYLKEKNISRNTLKITEWEIRQYFYM